MLGAAARCPLLCAMDTGTQSRWQAAACGAVPLTPCGWPSLTVASQPSPAVPLLVLRQSRPSGLTSQQVWMCCLAGKQ